MAAAQSVVCPAVRDKSTSWARRGGAREASTIRAGSIPSPIKARRKPSASPALVAKMRALTALRSPWATTATSFRSRLCVSAVERPSSGTTISRPRVDRWIPGGVPRSAASSVHPAASSIPQTANAKERFIRRRIPCCRSSRGCDGGSGRPFSRVPRPGHRGPRRRRMARGRNRSHPSAHCPDRSAAPRKVSPR